MMAARQDGGRREDLVVAVDGGGVKTDLALLEPGGRVLALVRGGGSSPYYLGVEGCAELLENLLAQALTQAAIGPPERPFASVAHILLAGADLPEELSAIRARLEQLDWSERLVVENDTFALLRAGTERGWGVAVVCGAGINCLGLASDGRTARFLSFGQISGDWGGGADVGLAALIAATRSADGRGPRTILETVVPAHFGVSGPLEVSCALHVRELSMDRLGELAPVVLASAEEDQVAAAIVQHLAEEVVAFAGAAIRRLELTTADPDVVLGGGLLRAVSPSVVEAIAAGVRKVAPAARVSVSPSEPIVGAALLAFDALGTDPSVTARARAELDAARAAAQWNLGGSRAATPAAGSR